MKKLIVVLVLFLSSLNSFALGKLVVQGNRNFATDTYKKYSLPLVGLVIYEPIFKNFMAYNSYMGYGTQDFSDDARADVHYYVVKSDVDFLIKRMTLSVGGTIKYVMPYESMANDVHAKVSFKLWD